MSFMTNPANPARRVKIIAYGAVLSAVYVVYAGISSATIGQILQGVDVHFVRAFVLVIGAAQVKRFGVPTVIGFVSGLLFASLAIGAPPDFIFLIPATIAAGLTYDVALRGGDYAKNATTLRRIFAATLLSSLSESMVVIGGLVAIGWQFTQSEGFLAAILGVAPPLAVLIFFLLGRNVLLSALGAGTGSYLLNRFRRNISGYPVKA
jgi:hypothetical protein